MLRVPLGIPLDKVEKEYILASLQRNGGQQGAHRRGPRDQREDALQQAQPLRRRGAGAGRGRRHSRAALGRQGLTTPRPAATAHAASAGALGGVERGVGRVHQRLGGLVLAPAGPAARHAEGRAQRTCRPSTTSGRPRGARAQTRSAKTRPSSAVGVREEDARTRRRRSAPPKSVSRSSSRITAATAAMARSPAAWPSSSLMGLSWSTSAMTQVSERPVAAGPLHLLVEPGAEGAQVGEAGERVGLGQLAKRRLACAAGGASARRGPSAPARRRASGGSRPHPGRGRAPCRRRRHGR